MPTCKDCNSEMIWMSWENGYNVWVCPYCLQEDEKTNKNNTKKNNN